MDRHLPHDTARNARFFVGIVNAAKMGIFSAGQQAARLGRDNAARRYLDANATPLAATLTAIEENRRAITGGEDA